VRRGPDEIDRRTLVLGGVTVAAAAVAGGVVAGAAAGIGRAAGGVKAPEGQTVTLSPTRPAAAGSAPSNTTTTAPGSGTAAPTGTPIGSASQVPVGGAAQFTDPKTGNPGLVLQTSKGQFVAYDAVCPHAGCTVGYSPAAKLIVCPCHGSEFDPNTGAVVSPPAPHGLTPIRVAEDTKGELVVED
jgi:thiosulfate dehydrogenase [quinone] large subunit